MYKAYTFSMQQELAFKGERRFAMAARLIGNAVVAKELPIFAESRLVSKVVCHGVVEVTITYSDRPHWFMGSRKQEVKLLFADPSVFKKGAGRKEETSWQLVSAELIYTPERSVEPRLVPAEQLVEALRHAEIGLMMEPSGEVAILEGEEPSVVIWHGFDREDGRNSRKMWAFSNVAEYIAAQKAANSMAATIYLEGQLTQEKAAFERASAALGQAGAA